MKVQCDVCAAEAASVFCCADEAALCDACDRRVHRANKLAGKHRRFSLLHPCSASSSAAAPAQAQKPPLCDICQERRGFLFCKEDRAILCRECDAPVHSTSDMTRRHSRFLLTGVRLSSAPVDSADDAGPSEEEDVEEEEQENSSSPCNDGSCSAGAGAGATTASASDGSSISEYLTKTLPGWHVEDFLMDDASAGGDVVAGACSDGLYQHQQGQHGQISGVLQEAYMPWTGREQVLADVADERARWERWVPQMQMRAEFAGGSKRPRASPSPPCPYW